MFAPARTPTAIIRRLNQEIVRAITTPDMRQTLLASGLELVGSTPNELAQQMKSDVDAVSRLIKDTGIHVPN
jgi:tripartite-type tricarboxylate transporter receptor subunit TctC